MYVLTLIYTNNTRAEIEFGTYFAAQSAGQAWLAIGTVKSFTVAPK